MLPGCKHGEIRHRMRLVGVLRRLGRDDDPFPGGFLKLGDSVGPVAFEDLREMLRAKGWSLEEMK